MLMETGYSNDDEEVKAMSHYFDRLSKVKESGKEVQTKHIKKGLAAVLR